MKLEAFPETVNLSEKMTHPRLDVMVSRANTPVWRHIMVLGLAVLLALSRPFGASAQGTAPPPAIAAWKTNVVLIEATLVSKDGTPVRQQQGYGFIVSQRADQVYIVTANHVVRDGDATADKPTITFQQEQVHPVQGVLGKKLLSGKLGDLTVITATVPAGITINFGPQANEPATPGQHVWLIGRNGRWDTKMSSGSVDEVVHGMIRVEDVGAMDGSSGGPLLSEEGVIGMLVDDKPTGTLAVPIKEIQATVEDWGVTWMLKAAALPPKESAASKPAEPTATAPAAAPPQDVAAAKPVSPAPKEAAEERPHEPDSCKTVRLAVLDPHEMPHTLFGASVPRVLASEILTDLGYETRGPSSSLTVADTFAALSDKSLDVFLGDFSPDMDDLRKPYTENKSVDILSANLEGTKYWVAAPEYLQAKGLHDINDIKKFGKDLNYKIYTFKGDFLADALIQDGSSGLSKFKAVVLHDPATMNDEVSRLVLNNKPVVFVSPDPYPYPEALQATSYLGGGDPPGTIQTSVRAGYANECPNVGRLLRNLKFTVDLEDAVGSDIVSGKPADAAARDGLKANQTELFKWLDGVTTIHGKPGLPRVLEKLRG